MKVEKLKGNLSHGRCQAADCTMKLGPGPEPYRSATHRVTMADYDTLLCAEHARAWEKIYDRALGILEDMKAAA